MINNVSSPHSPPIEFAFRCRAWKSESGAFILQKQRKETRSNDVREMNEARFSSSKVKIDAPRCCLSFSPLSGAFFSFSSAPLQILLSLKKMKVFFLFLVAFLLRFKTSFSGWRSSVFAQGKENSSNEFFTLLPPPFPLTFVPCYGSLEEVRTSKGKSLQRIRTFIKKNLRQ